MKRSKAEVEKRQQTLLSLLVENEEISVSELSARLAVSEVTIRRDLRVLMDMGKIIRSHGRIVVRNYLNIDGEKIDEIELIKIKIGRAAANLIKEHQTIFVNSGSTPLYAVQALKNKPINILTNNIHTAEIKHHPDSVLILSGGEVRQPKETLVGDIAANFFEQVNADAAIIGVYGINATNGVTTPVPHESKINRIMLKQTTGAVIALADYRKIGMVANFSSGSIEQIDYLITDTFADEHALNDIRKAGVTVIQIPI
jgi:DeoR/GlpR family transcriptional regulator of sugar metabolism